MDREVSARGAERLKGARAGWIGVGKMGAPMARHLLASGVAVTVSDPSETQRNELAAHGASVAGQLSAFVEADIVFAALPNDDALRAVVFDARDAESDGLASTLRPGGVFVEMSTVSPKVSADVAEALDQKGILYLRAPLSGSTAMAEAASLTVLASGDSRAWDMARPFFEVMSAKQFYLGAGEEARFMKLVLNALVGASSAVLAEALNLGAHGGLSRADMMQVICESAVASPLFKYKADAVVADDYAPAFSVAQMVKDFSLISEAARHENMPLMVNGLILELYRAAANSGLQDQDFFSLVKWHRSLTNM